MKPVCRPAIAAALILPLLLSGCALIVTRRKLPVPKAPLVVHTVTPEALVDQLDQRWAAIESLNATVDMQASTLNSREGVAKDYTTFRGHILMRKPELLRVLGQVPVLGTRMFDMASNGKNFTLYIPLRSKAFKGSNTLKKKSANLLENLRPGFFFDALAVHGLEPGDLYAVTADTDTVVDASKKHLLLNPEYVLSIMRRTPDSSQLTPVRVVTFHREDLLPYQQDMYDKDGNLETQVSYSAYQDFGSTRYPTKIIIKRPLEEYQVVLTVENVKENMTLTDDQFEIKVPEGTTVQHLE
jgi:outer membrane lipoprotein-sorting protein